MPTKLRRLKSEALEACRFRGHKMLPWLTSIGARYHKTQCETCKRFAFVCLRPLPNEVDIFGEAVALNCEVAK